MPTKFPIDYVPGTRHFYLIDKETGEKMSEIFQMKEFVPKPWPIDDIEIETESEPPKSLTLSGTFTLKTKMKANQRRKLIRALSGKQKLPRKLKKALKHLELKEPRFEEIKIPNGVGSIAHMEIGPKEGYPHTKWIWKAVHLLRKRMAIVPKIRHQGTTSNMNKYLLPL
jgi:hypothetical protein